MVRGSGIDILATNRFRTLKNKPQFINSILTQKELAQASKYFRRDTFCAALFTLKEAILKAFGCGLHHGSFWQHIEIDQKLSPIISRPLFDSALEQPTKKVHVSFACTKNYTLSIALTETEE